MIAATRIRKGMLLKIDGELYRVHDYQHITPGNWRALMQTRLKNLRTGAIIEHRFLASDKVERASLEARPFEFLYQDGDHFIFMDKQTYEQVTVDSEVVGEAAQLLKSNLDVIIESHDGKPLAVNLPKTVDLEVVECEPGLRGATVTNVGKPLKLETGLVITGPQFINIGDLVRVDTEEYAYVERVSTAK